MNEFPIANLGAINYREYNESWMFVRFSKLSTIYYIIDGSLSIKAKDRCFTIKKMIF